jgi:hypothetical protein
LIGPQENRHCGYSSLSTTATLQRHAKMRVPIRRSDLYAI